MSSGLDMSLDDLIKQSKTTTTTTRPKGGPAASSSSGGPTRRGPPPPARSAPYLTTAGPKATAASPYGVYSEHVAAMAGIVQRPPPPGARTLETGTKLHISNLDSGVTVEDVQELFSEIGELKRYSVNYDKDGKSQGTAEVVFARKVDALDAIKRYDGVILDGKPMKIDLIGSFVVWSDVCATERYVEKFNDNMHLEEVAAKEDHFKVMVAPEAVRALEVAQEDFKAAVVLETVVKAVVAVARGEPVEMNGIV
uniref:RRM domain-containing protein n=1 Tax=Leersia perrieri TaxID=77586 RepID=A0A0D9WX24_9ORYZ